MSPRALRAGFGLLGAVAPGASLDLAERIFTTPRGPAPTPEERALLARGEPLELRGGYAATAWGEGPSVLLVHGWQRHRASLGAFVAPLVATGRRVVAFDAPAHGDSPGRRLVPIDYARALLRVGAELGPLDGIVGHSMGGGAAVIALGRGLEARRAVLLAPASDWEHQIRLFARFVGLPGDLSERFVRRFEAQLGAPLDAFTPPALCPGLAAPALLFHDPADSRVPHRDSVALARHWPKARLVDTPGLGHGGALRDDGVVAETVRFLS